MLTVSALEAGYGDVQVLFGVSLHVGKGEVVTLLGRNGMGKTTTIRALLGLATVTAGSVRFRGERIDGLAPERIARLGIALVPEGRQIFPNLSVEENLRVGAHARRDRSPPRRSARACRRRHHGRHHAPRHGPQPRRHDHGPDPPRRLSAVRRGGAAG